MKEYRIMNRVTEEWWNGKANSAQEACEKAGWPIGDCWVRVKTPVRVDSSNPTGSGYSGGGWAIPEELKKETKPRRR